MPGAAERYVRKLVSDINCDVAVIDLEDGVAPGELTEARQRTHAVLTSPNERLKQPVCVRTHAVTTSEFRDDLDAVLAPHLAALMLPKVTSEAEVVHVDALLGQLGSPDVQLVVMIESAAGLAALPHILRASSRIVAVAFGAEDYAADLNLPPELDLSVDTSNARRTTLDHARTSIVASAVANGVKQRIEAPSLELNDLIRVQLGARRARAMGFSGMFAVHPSQVSALHRGFAPSKEEVRWALTVLGTVGGAHRLGSRMVDKAVLRQAREILVGSERSQREEVD